MTRRIDEVGGYCIPPNTLITSFRALDEGSFLGSFHPHLGSNKCLEARLFNGLINEVGVSRFFEFAEMGGVILRGSNLRH